MTERIKYFRTHAVTKSFENASIYPAHAGINRIASGAAMLVVNLPRTRGDKPKNIPGLWLLLLSTPHTRG